MPLPARIACSPWWKGEFLYDHGIYTDGLYADTAAEMRDLVKWVKNSD